MVKNKNGNIWTRWRFTYKLLIFNEKTLEEVFNVRLSRFTAFLYFCAALVVVFGLMSMLIMFTPIKHFLPGSSDISVRSNLTGEIVKIDSLSKHIILQDMQIQAMKNIISGTVPFDSIIESKNISPEKWEHFADEKSKLEQKFVEEYENDDYFYPSVLRDKGAVKTKLFSAPAFGEIVEKFDKTQTGIKIAVKSGQNVLAVGAGAVIFSAFTLDNGYFMAIQHDNGYISIYKNLSQITKNVGENVATGEVIAVVSSAKNNVPSVLSFEIWHNGKPVNPEDIVIF